MSSGGYLMVVPVPGVVTGPTTFATEGPFADHLRLLRKTLGKGISEFVVAAPELDPSHYESRRAQMKELRSDADGIRFRPLFPASLGRIQYWWQLPRVMRTLYEEVRNADFVHASNSHLDRPLEFPALVIAKQLGKKTISVTDIDNRQSAKMMRANGTWSTREYLWTRLVHAPWIHLQQSYGVRNFSLVLLKGADLVEDYGKGRSNVRFFLDSAFCSEQIIPPAKLEEKVARIRSATDPLRVVYFGRLVDYKGVDHMLRAIAHAKNRGANLTFDVIGDGPSADALKRLARELKNDSVVNFVGALPFGPRLFEALYGSDVLLAAPLAQDTPRSVLDAAAAGVPTLAFDTYYYKDLGKLGGAVELVPWLNAEAMGDALVQLAQDRTKLADLAVKAVDFAKDNTQEIWLQRRADWTLETSTKAPS